MAQRTKINQQSLLVFSRLCGGFAIAVGVMVMAGWYAHWTSVVQLMPHLVPMKFNTALGFALCGLSLYLLTTCRSQLVPWLGAVITLLGMITLIEFVLGRNLGIDELFFKYYVMLATETSGRMSPLTASCFSFLGLALTITGSKGRTKLRMTLIGVLTCVVAVISAVAVFGYSFGIESAYGWGSYSRMALHTAITFLALSAGLLTWAYGAANKGNSDFTRWLLVTGSVTMMAMIAFVSAITIGELEESTVWRKHSYEVLSTAQILLGDIFDIQRGMRGYAMTGSPATLDTYRAGLKNAQQDLAQLEQMTRDNPIQQGNLRPLREHLGDVMDYAERLIELRQQLGIQMAVQLESTGQGFAAANHTLADLHTITTEEHRLLEQRSNMVDANFRKTVHLLVIGSGLAAILLILANLMASHEMKLRRRAEVAQRKIVSMQKAILNSANYAMISTSTEGVVMSFNSTAERWLGYSAEEVVGKQTPALWHDAGEIVERAAVLSKQLGRKIEPGFEVFTAKVVGDYSDETEWTFIRKDGSRFPVSLSATALTDEVEGITGYLGVISDITERKRYEQELRDARARAESSDRAKSEFLAIMSHEIRTPMNGVIGMTTILADTELNEMQRDCVNTISTSGESLMTVINDILDFSKIESGQMKLESRSFNLERCIEDAIDLFAAPIRVKGLEAVYLVAPEIPAHLMGDSLRLRQILVNLLGNALKFTSKGEIAINVEQRSVDENGHHLVFGVTDTGIGISKEGLDKLFKAFQQVDTSTTRRYGGTGLGLVISKRMAEFMGGTMWVESEPGVGSTFFFSVVLKASNVPDTERQSPVGGVLTSHTVLIVDDNATNRRILEIQAKIWGMKPTTASSGAEALQKLKEQPFDAGLIDFQMPEMDGVTLAKEIRIRSQTPLILLSSSGEIITGEEASLFQMQIPKPLKHSTLFNALLKITGAETRPTLKMPEKKFDRELGTTHPLRLLLAEDNAVNQKVGLLMLSRLGYSADVAKNGLEAVAAVEKGRYDLILMDIQMPEMNGIEASGRIREKLGASCPAIIALTAEALEGDQQRFLALGFNGYLSKPLQVPALAEVLKSVKKPDPSPTV